MIASTSCRSWPALLLLVATACPDGSPIQVVEPDAGNPVDAAAPRDGAIAGDAAGGDSAAGQDRSGGTDAAAGTDQAAGVDTAIGQDHAAATDAGVGVDQGAGADTGAPVDSGTSCSASSCTDPNRAVCVSDDAGIHCRCDPGFYDYGDGVCRPANPCASNPCTQPNRTVCVAVAGIAQCFCDDGFGDPGSGVCQPAISCTPNPCLQPNKHTCSLVDGHTHCDCDTGFTESSGLCVPTSGDPCSPNPCQVANRGVCSVVNSQAVCSCNTGYEEDGLGGCTAVVAPPCPDTSCGTAITGRVTHGGAAWPGLTVTVYTGSCPLNGFLRSTTTDAAGYYQFDNLSTTGAHYLRAAGSADARWYNPGGGSSACLARTAVSVTSGQTSRGIDIAFPAGGAIGGRATASGSGVGPGLQIEFYRQQCGVTTVSQEVLTDASGYYTARGLPAGSYYVKACPACRAGFESYAARWWTGGGGSGRCEAAAQVEVAVRTLTPAVDFVLEASADISGTITFGAEPVSGVLVHAYDATCASGHLVDAAFSASDGVFHLPNLPAGTFYLETRMRNLVSPRYADLWWSSGNGTFDCSAATASTVAAGTSLGGRDFALLRGGSVSGTVTQSSAPVVGAYVWAHVADCARSDERAWFQPALTDGAGAYRIQALPPGTVRLYISPNDALPGVVGWYNGGSVVTGCAAAATVTVTDAVDTPGNDFAF